MIVLWHHVEGRLSRKIETIVEDSQNSCVSLSLAKSQLILESFEFISSKALWNQYLESETFIAFFSSHFINATCSTFAQDANFYIVHKG